MSSKTASDPPLAGDVIAERAIERLTPDGSRPGKITIYKPAPTGPGEWGCRYTITGIRDDGSTVDEIAPGVDSAQAFQALFLVGVAFIREPVVTEGVFCPRVLRGTARPGGPPAKLHPRAEG
jgi:hypothetical protein